MLLKRHRSSENETVKRHRRSSEELLPHDVVVLILERLPVKSLLRFKSVSKKWKSTIESRCFQEQQFLRRRQSRGPDVLCVSIGDDNNNNNGYDEAPMNTVSLGSSIVSRVRLPTSNYILCPGSCDGLLCVYCVFTPSVVVNPATRLHQSFPLCNLQQFRIDMYDKGEYDYPSPKLGFGKDKFTSTYKPVWLYNSTEFGLENVTTCEVFDFSTNAWRYVLPASPYRINDVNFPVYFDGSLYWLTLCEETKLLSFDLHTETFQVICKAPFTPASDIFSHSNRIMCILNNRLCVSENNGATQVIWSLDSSGLNKTWKILCSIDFTKTVSWFGDKPLFPVKPIEILDDHKLLVGEHGYLVLHDLHAKSYDLLCLDRETTLGYPVSYFQSLFSVLPNSIICTDEPL
ncbi:Galactose oxidase/kelch beta-propeller [Arabidopsis thaliana x Arabidopsis arenosa]|uniref:Galactose oxidase/kelch beta-propeller n=1 Tax=Arabidopsis thaliana x Arabidopsis arenosa TaxID=1240361 RepID=A0A8T2C668_9BRAS|nr:Galactose oxidase/kelch beta-propeller [Arabidopsis thaliana x Arabidopsis arenosa]